MLNLLFNDKTKYIDGTKYNYAPFFYMVYGREPYYDSAEELETNCRIVHMHSGSKPWENVNRMAADELWWKYAARTPFYSDMKMKHIQAMLHKEQKMNNIIDGKIKKISESVNSAQVLNDVEELLYQMLEIGFGILERLTEAM